MSKFNLMGIPRFSLGLTIAGEAQIYSVGGPTARHHEELAAELYTLRGLLSWMLQTTGAQSEGRATRERPLCAEWGTALGGRRRWA